MPANENLTKKIIDYGLKYALIDSDQSNSENVIAALEKIGASIRAMALRILTIDNGPPSPHSKLNLHDQQVLLSDETKAMARHIADYMFKRDEGMEIITEFSHEPGTQYTPEEVYRDEPNYLPANERAIVLQMSADTLLDVIKRIETLRDLTGELDKYGVLDSRIDFNDLNNPEILEKAQLKTKKEIIIRLAPSIHISILQSFLRKESENPAHSFEVSSFLKEIVVSQLHGEIGSNDFFLSDKDPQMPTLKKALGLEEESSLEDVRIAVSELIEKEYNERIKKALGLTPEMDENQRKTAINHYLNKKLAAALGLNENTPWLEINDELETK